MERKKILIAEDMPQLREIVVERLEREFNVFSARDGVEALECLKNNNIDCIVLDLDMPRMDGMEVLNYIRSNNYYTFVIVATGISSIEHAQYCADQGVNGYICKPYSIKELRDRIYKVLGLIDLKPYRSPHESKKTTHPKVLDTMKFVQVNYMKQISIERLAREMGIASAYLARLFKKSTGKTLTQYVNHVRIEKATLYLMNSDLPVSQIFYQVGYTSEQHFFTQFKKIMNVTPLEYRNSN